MNHNKCYDLPCFDGRKSFYGKARVIEDSEGNRMLQSYTTYICIIRADGGLIKLNPVATPTTRRHIRSFFAFLGYAYPGNREWDALETEKSYPLTKEGATA